MTGYLGFALHLWTFQRKAQTLSRRVGRYSPAHGDLEELHGETTDCEPCRRIVWLTQLASLSLDAVFRPTCHGYGIVTG
jgi:hypothetical protein